jgi:Tfp pilus assembly protein PilF
MLHWRSAVRADPGNAAAWQGIARCAAALDRADAANAAWLRRLQLVPSDLEAMGAVGEAVARTADFEGALALLLTARQGDVDFVDSSTPWRREILIYSLLKAIGRDAAAEEVGTIMYADLSAAAREDPPGDAADARWRRLLHQMHAQGVPGAALSAAMARGFMAHEIVDTTRGSQRAMARATAARFHSAALALAAHSRVSSKNIMRYIDQASDADGIRLLPAFRDPMSRVDAIERSALLSMELGHKDIAESLLREAHALAPGQATVANALGWLLLERDGVQREAVTLIEQAAAAAPDNPAVLDSLGWLRLKQGRSSEAVTLLERARAVVLPLVPRLEAHGGPLEDPEILFHLGEALQAAGRNDEAQAVRVAALHELTGVAAQWRLADGSVQQRRDWGLQVVKPQDLYTHRFSWLEQVLRQRLTGNALEKRRDGRSQ